ncbi:MAG TPA: methyl-accepting chemotaxis protein [Candidatus Didemnitutus sp.]|nr:methyl-accepting chemotaxis protein [Candidatus Didemnitutus sp.]
MKNWTIGQRITCGGAILCALLATVGGIAWFNLGAIRTNADVIDGDVIPGLINSGRFTTSQMENFVRALLRAQAKTPEEKARLDQATTETSAKIDEALKAYEASINTAEDRALFQQLGELRKEYRDKRTAYFKLIDAGKADEAYAFLLKELYPMFQTYTGRCAEIFALNARNGDLVSTEISANTVRSTRTIFAVTIVAFVVAVLIGWVIIRSTGSVLNFVTSQLGAGADQTAAAATQLSASSQSLAEGSSEQAASLEETSASLEEIASMTKRNADSATQAKDLANKTRQAADLGAGSMAEMKQAMDAIKESSSNIAKIVKTIDEIAFQTNILALNAAVEAARAGEAGAGFAVVAEEVRSLAQRSAQSAKETAARIEESVTRSENGVQISVKVAQSFEEIVTKARQVDELVAEIATASNEQNQGIGQVTTAVAQMDKVTQSNAAGAEESASASEELSAQAEMMRDAVRSLQQLVGRAAKAATYERERPAASAKPVATAKMTKQLITPVHKPAGARPGQLATTAAGSHDEFFK